MPPTSSRYSSVLDFASDDALVKAMQSVSVSGDSVIFNDWVPSSYNKQTSVVPTVEHEVQRLNALRSYAVLDSQPEEAFDLITAEVRDFFGVSWACINFVDLGRQWCKSQHGPNVHDIARTDAFCAHTILQIEGVLEIKDTLQDPRFHGNPIVVGSPYVRFYAGAPLLTPEGFKIGCVCIMDTKARPEGLSQRELEALECNASHVMQMLVKRRAEFGGRRLSGEKRDRVVNGSIDSPQSLRDLVAKKLRLDDGAPSVIPRPILPSAVLPDPKTSDVDPDRYLSLLTEAMLGVSVKIKPALELKDFFPTISEHQIAAYSVEVVSATRENKVEALREFYALRGRSCLDCFNRFGEGLLNMACRRGFKEIVQFLLSSEVNLSVRVCDDYGRTPLHDACWHPEPQLEICSWIIDQDPSLFLVADKRGFTPFQYARQSDWQVWRQFLFDNRGKFEKLVHPEVLSRFA